MQGEVGKTYRCLSSTPAIPPVVYRKIKTGDYQLVHRSSGQAASEKGPGLCRGRTRAEDCQRR
jgi:hypothetical protein